MIKYVPIIAVLVFLVGCQVQGGLPAGCPQPLPVDTTPTQPETSEPLVTTPVAPEGSPVKVVSEGDLVHFPNLKATDPDGDPISYTFSFPLNEEGEWQTEKGDAGEYLVRITASDGQNEVVQTVKLIVQEVNEPPVIEMRDTVTVEEGDMIELAPTIRDADDDDIEVTYSGWLDSNKYQTTFEDAGEHAVLIQATDGKTVTEHELTVLVKDVNRAPVLTPIRDILVEEGDTITLLPQAIDPDGDEVTFTFEEPFDESGVWETTAGDQGSYRVSVEASDGDAQDSTAFFVVVERKNLPPVISGFEDVTVEEGDVVMLTPVVTDPNGDEVTITYSGWMTSASRQTDYGDAGEYEVTLTVADLEHTVTETITVTVQDVNRPPVFGEGAFS